MTEQNPDPIHPDAVVGNAMPVDDEDHSAPGEDVDPLAALLGGGGGGAGGLDLGALMEQASQMQSQMAAAQEAAEATSVEGVAGGGVVRVVVNGGFEFQSVTISPEAVDRNDVEMLQDLVLAALHDAVNQIAELQQSSMDVSGLDLGGLLGGN